MVETKFYNICPTAPSFVSANLNGLYLTWVLLFLPFKADLHWQKSLQNPPQNWLRQRKHCTCLGYLGRCATNGNDSIIALPKVAEAGTVLVLSQAILPGISQ
jgi:hypothetical protein